MGCAWSKFRTTTILQWKSFEKGPLTEYDPLLNLALAVMSLRSVRIFLLREGRGRITRPVSSTSDWKYITHLSMVLRPSPGLWPFSVTMKKECSQAIAQNERSRRLTSARKQGKSAPLRSSSFLLSSLGAFSYVDLTVLQPDRLSSKLYGFIAEDDVLIWQIRD